MKFESTLIRKCIGGGGGVSVRFGNLISRPKGSLLSQQLTAGGGNLVVFSNPEDGRKYVIPWLCFNNLTKGENGKGEQRNRTHIHANTKFGLIHTLANRA